MAGSKVRTNIQGHTIVAEPDLVRELRRMSTAFIAQLFREAHEQGQSHVSLADHSYILHRHPDHTFTLQAEGEGHRSVI